MKLIDSHTHLSSDEFAANRDEVLARALSVCDYLIDIGSGTSHDAFERAKNLAEAHPQVYFTAGIHPHDAEAIGKNEKILSQIEELALHPKCVAVGECGLDYFYNHSSREAQISTFKWHIDLARKIKLPLMIHTRDAEDDTRKLLSDYAGPAVFHCFTGTQELAAFGVSKNFYVSFSGIVTFKSAQTLRDVFLKMPLENILIETDAPFLAPVPMRGKTNETSFIEHTAKFLANLRKMSASEFGEATSKNALSLFSKIAQPHKTT